MKKSRKCPLRSSTLKLLLVLLVTGLSALSARGQIHSAALGNYAHDNVLRIYRANGVALQSGIRPLILDKATTDSLSIKYNEEFNRKNTADGWGLRKLKYESLFVIDKPNFFATIDPLLHLQGGRDRSDSTGALYYRNTRGIRATASIGERLYIETNFYENQAVLPPYLDNFVQQYGVVPGSGRVKPFKTTGWDFANSTALAVVKVAPWFYLSGGQGQQFIGHGYRSLFLSDNNVGSPYVNGQFRFWENKLRYQVSYQAYRALARVQATQSVERPLQPKAGSFQYLSFAPSKQWEFGVFTSHLWKRWDSSGTRPVILSDYNPLPAAGLMSAGWGNNRMNSFLGIQAAFKPWKAWTLYTQVVFDDPQNSRGGFQLGAVGRDAFRLRGLDMRLEYNSLNKGTYYNADRHLRYVHYSQPLATPLGTGHNEWLAQIRYNIKDIELGVNYSYADYSESYFYFANELPDESRVRAGTDVYLTRQHLDLSLGYLVNRKTGMKLSLNYTRRSSKTSLNLPETNWFSVTLKTQLRNHYNDF